MEISQSLLQEVIKIAKIAGGEILAIYNLNAPLNIQTKMDKSPVTKADLLAHQIIVEGLAKLVPQFPILSEEDPDVAFSVRQKWNTFWLVDPLDGTQEFIHRSGQFTVNIALIKEGKPVLGVIFVPLKNVLYYAANGCGAFKKEGGGAPVILQISPWFSGDDITLVATRKELHENLQQELSVYGNIKITYRSSSLKFCLLAEGRADIYLRKTPIHEWDTAAGQCIVEQAGGIVLDSNWEALRYNTKSHLLNPPFIALGDSTQLLPLLKTMPMFLGDDE